MESREIHCQKCNKTTHHTFRYHITKTKHYSVVSVGSGKKEITLVCHVCLLETYVDKNFDKNKTDLNNQNKQFDGNSYKNKKKKSYNQHK